jgi:uncharacterized protein (TIGR02246 family)
MSRPEEDRSALNYFLDSERIKQAVNRYYRALDEKDFGESRLQELFTPDARLTRPHGTFLVGPKNIGDSQSKSFARFRNTQHILTGHDVEIDGDAATVRANLIAIHVWKDSPPAERDILKSSFIAGGIVTSKLLRSADGKWRISSAENRVIWRAGSFGNMLETDKL